MSVLISKQMVVPSMDKLLSDYAVGESVFLNVNGTKTEFLVVNQGIPSNSNLYDASCNGTWLLMKDIYTNRAWDGDDNDYENSSIRTYLNGTFFGLFDSATQSVIKQVKIPYHKGLGNNGSVYSKSSGLSTKIFLLSGYEVGWINEKSEHRNYLPIDGASVDYFKGCAATDSKRIAYYNGTATTWWLRSPHLDDYGWVWDVLSSTGGSNYNYSNQSIGVRPALVMPFETLFDGKTNEFIGEVA